MAIEPNMKKFETHIPIDMWERYETWAEEPGRGKILKRQLAAALFRLFLAAPDDVKLLALYGTEDRLYKVLDVLAKILWKVDLADEIVTAAANDAQAQRQRPDRRKKAASG